MPGGDVRVGGVAPCAACKVAGARSNRKRAVGVFEKKASSSASILPPQHMIAPPHAASVRRLFDLRTGKDRLHERIVAPGLAALRAWDVEHVAEKVGETFGPVVVE